MSYQPDKLVELAVDLLRRQPRLTASEVSEKLLVHRHTLNRALKAGGRSLALIRQVLERLHVHFTCGRTTSFKEVWTELGFASASSFARYIRQVTGKSPSEYRADRALGQTARKSSKMSLELGPGGGKSILWNSARCQRPQLPPVAD